MSSFLSNECNFFKSKKRKLAKSFTTLAFITYLSFEAMFTVTLATSLRETFYRVLSFSAIHVNFRILKLNHQIIFESFYIVKSEDIKCNTMIARSSMRVIPSLKHKFFCKFLLLVPSWVII